MPTDNVRVLKKIDFATIITFTAGATCTAGVACSLSAAMTVGDAPAGSDVIVGVTLGNVGQTFLTGARVQVGLAGPVFPMKVGTGGTTRGTKQKVVADGITDAPTTLNAGATTTPIMGIALESGVAGDFVGVIMVPSNRISA